MVKWFICQNEDVSGPFTTEEVKDKVSSGEVSESMLIWSRAQKEWMSISGWEQELPTILTRVKESKAEQTWHFVFEGTSNGPFVLPVLVEKLNKIEDKSEIHVWTSGMKDWIPLFECHEIMEAIGISRRKHPRAEIDGTVSVNVNEQDYIGQLKMVSAGGCGISGVVGLHEGQHVSVTLRSESFYKPLNATAEVRYVTDSGFIGLQFLSINMEEKAAIIDFVRDRIVKKALAS